MPSHINEDESSNKILKSSYPTYCDTNISCNSVEETDFPYGICEKCSCKCDMNVGYFKEDCCEDGLLYNVEVGACDLPSNIPGCY